MSIDPQQPFLRTLAPLLRAKLEYPAEPIVDLRKSRAAAIEAFQALA